MLLLTMLLAPLSRSKVLDLRCMTKWVIEGGSTGLRLEEGDVRDDVLQDVREMWNFTCLVYILRFINHTLLLQVILIRHNDLHVPVRTYLMPPPSLRHSGISTWGIPG
jgi:hypothetical protein